MEAVNKYTPPRITKGKKPINIPRGSTLQKEWAKNIWYVNYTFNGKQYRIKGEMNRIKDPVDKQEYAEALLKSIRDQLKAGFNPSNPEPYLEQVKQNNILIEEAVAQYLEALKGYARPKTVKSYQSKLRYLIEAFPQKEVKNFTEKDLEKYIREKIQLQKPAKIFLKDKAVTLNKSIPWTPKTITNARGVFSAFFRYCIENKYYTKKNPASLIQPKYIRSEISPKARHVPFTKEDIASIMNYLDEHDKNTAFFCRIIYYTCLRPGEISQLRLKDIDMENRSITVPLSVSKNTKLKKAETVFIDSFLISALNDLQVENYNSEYYLVSSSENIFGSAALKSDQAYKRFRKALKKVNLADKGYTLYSFKHFSNITRVNDGWKLSEIMKANRHSSISMTEIYLRDLTRHTDIKQKVLSNI